MKKNKYNKKRAKFNKCIDHSDSPLIDAKLVIERKLNPPMGIVHYIMPKFDW